MSIDFLTNATGTLGVLATHHHDGPPWPAFIFFPLLLLTIVTIVVWNRRTGPRRSGAAVLAERYARGEIEADEYRQRREELRRT
jgi:putative membrane protein